MLPVSSEFATYLVSGDQCFLKEVLVVYQTDVLVNMLMDSVLA